MINLKVCAFLGNSFLRYCTLLIKANFDWRKGKLSSDSNNFMKNAHAVF